MYISSVELNDFRCYHKASTTFVHPGMDRDLPRGVIDNVTLLIGPNGSGKTSILRAVALGVLAPIIKESGYRPYYLVRRPKPGRADIGFGWVSVMGVLDQLESGKLQGDEPHAPPNVLDIRADVFQRNDYDIVALNQLPWFRDRTDLERLLEKLKASIDPRDRTFVYDRESGTATVSQLHAALNEFYKDYSPSFFLLGYGANRRVQSPQRAAFNDDGTRGRRYVRAAGLFEEEDPLFPLAAWLPQLAKKKERYKEVVQLLNDTLPPGTRFSGEFHPDRQPCFIHGGVKLPFPALSDGYRSYIGLLGDILHNLVECCQKGQLLTEMTGVVMVDDIDLHLHPKWQRRVVPRLAKAFKRLQFILTTHSPLVAGTVYAANARVIGKHKVHQFDEELHGLSVEQILSSRYFEYTKPRSDEADEKLKMILEGRVDNGDANPALAFLQTLTGK